MLKGPFPPCPQQCLLPFVVLIIGILIGIRSYFVLIYMSLFISDVQYFNMGVGHFDALFRKPPTWIHCKVVFGGI